MTGSPSPWDYAFTGAAWPPVDDGDIDVALDDPDPDALPPEFTFDTDPQR